MMLIHATRLRPLRFSNTLFNPWPQARIIAAGLRLRFKRLPPRAESFPMNNAVQAWLSLFLCAAALYVLFGGRRAVWTTTLRAGWCWAVTMLAVISVIELIVGLSPSASNAHAELLRFVAAVSVFTPTMALLGAKRPQIAAWQFVVVTLWGVLALPALELWMRGRGEELAIDPVRSCFIVMMIAVGAVNHFPTRFGLAAGQLAIAQAVLLWPHLPLVGSSAARPPVWLACGLFLTSALTARYAAGRVRRDSHVRLKIPAMPSWSLVWRDFRDWYGTVWAVRVMERINASAAMNVSPLRLGWDGFFWGDSTKSQEGEPRSDQIAAEQLAAVEQSLRSLLRRFVSAEWIENRLTSYGP